MKRINIFLFVAFVAAILAPLDLVVSGSNAYLGSAEVSAAPLGPGNTAVPATNSGTGRTNASPTPSVFLDEKKPVCVGIPITTKGLKKTAACPGGEIPNDQPGGAIIFYLKQVLFLLNSLVGGIIILVLVIAGIQYIVSSGDPANVKKAKGRVMNAVIALVLYMMMVAILNFLVPGGLL